MQRAASVTPLGLLGFSDSVHPPPAADDALDVVGGPGAAHRQQSLFGVRGGHPRQRSDLGIGQLAVGQGLG